MLSPFISYVRRHHVGLFALFVALGGTAVAAATIGPTDIKPDAVRAKHIKDGRVGTEDVAVDGSGKELTGDNINELTLVTRTGELSGRIDNIGTGSTLFGPLSGGGAASATFASVATGKASHTSIYTNLLAAVPAPLAAGQSRTFTVVRGTLGGASPNDTALSCTIGAGLTTCNDDANNAQLTSNGQGVAIKVTGAGAGLSAGDDAFVGVAVENNP